MYRRNNKGSSINLIAFPSFTVTLLDNLHRQTQHTDGWVTTTALKTNYCALRYGARAIMFRFEIYFYLPGSTVSDRISTMKTVYEQYLLYPNNLVYLTIFGGRKLS